MDERQLADYLAVLRPVSGYDHTELRRGQFHDVVLAGEVAYRFPRDEASRRRLPGAIMLLRALSRRGGVPVPPR